MDKAEASTTGQLLQKKGLAHEAACLQQLKDEGKSVVEIPKERNLQDRAKLTLEAIQSGADVIYQAVFFAPPWRGDADFLIKCDTPSSLGGFSYEVLDTTLARTAEPKHIMQLRVYSELPTDLQGLRPANMHLFLVDHEKHSSRGDDFFYYYTRAKGRFESSLQSLPADYSLEPCSHCNFCQWREGCKAQWGQDDPRLGVTGEAPLPINERLSHLLEFHNREATPQWRCSFERQNKFEDELIDDTEYLGGLQQIGAPEPEKCSLIYSSRFPSQEYTLKVGAQAC